MTRCPMCRRAVDGDYQAQCPNCGASLPLPAPSDPFDIAPELQSAASPVVAPPRVSNLPARTGSRAGGFFASFGVRIVIGLVIAGAFAGWRWFTEARRDHAGIITEAGDLGVFNIEIGDCLQWPGDDDALEVTRVEAVPCARSHELEVYALVDHPAPSGDPYPGDQPMFLWGWDECYNRFEGFVGAPYDEVPDLDISVFYPTEASWDQERDREVVCMINEFEGAMLIGSMAGREA